MASKPFAVVILAVIAAVVLAFMAHEVAGHEPMVCAPADQLIPAMIDKSGWMRFAKGRMRGGPPVEFFLTKAGDWFVIFIMPNGLACFRDIGDAFEFVPPPKMEPAL